MLNYSLMYKISSGIFLTFKNPDKLRKSMRHSDKTIEKFKALYPLKFCSEMTKDNFILLNIYINYKYKPSSLNSLLEKLNSINKENKIYKEFLKFKDRVLNYKYYLVQDIKFLTNQDEINLKTMFDFYKKNEINFYTFYFWIISQNISDDEIKSRIMKTEIKKIKAILQYITFPEKIIPLLKEKLTSIF